MRPAYRKYRTLAVIFVSMYLTLIMSCVEWSVPANPPQNVSATQGTEEDRVILTWDPVQRAGVYHIYRGASLDDTFAYLGSSAGTSYIDISIDPEIHYWYVVAVSDYQGRSEFELAAEPVEGWAFHTFEWISSVVAARGSAPSLAATRC